MENREPVNIVRVIRRLRGGSQAQLVEGHNGKFYAVKFAGNPQGTRTLINEWFASQLLQQFGISTPPVCVLCLPQTVLDATPDLVFQEKHRRPVSPGLHLGSQCPVNPESTAIYDFWPGAHLNKVVNPDDFAKVLVLDMFLANEDTRQAIFVRERGSPGLRMRAYMIDQGWTFGGSLWQLSDAPRLNLYRNPDIYSFCDLRQECQRTLDRVVMMTEDTLHQLGESIPPIWFTPHDHSEWATLLRRLFARKQQLPHIFNQYLQQLQQPGNRLSCHPDKASQSRKVCQAKQHAPDQDVPFGLMEVAL